MAILCEHILLMHSTNAEKPIRLCTGDFMRDLAYKMIEGCIDKFIKKSSLILESDCLSSGNMTVPFINR